MPKDSDEKSNVVEIDQVLADKYTEIDFDLTDSALDSGEGAGELDIKLGDYIPYPDDNDKVDYSVNKSLVTRPNSDVTVRFGKRHLEKMRENKLLDVHDFQEKRIVHPDMERFEILNAFREVRTKILQRSKGENQVIMVVSLQHEMGTTFSSVNLAAAFSYEGEKTSLLIDCDQHRRKLEKYFNEDVEYGLSDYLVDNQIDIEEIIHQTGISRMRYIPIGQRKSMDGEFFSSERMSDFITQVKKRYSDRFIILNTPPLEVTADAAILSEVADLILIVLPYGKVSQQRLKKSIKLLPKEKIIGIVINNKIRYV